MGSPELSSTLELTRLLNAWSSGDGSALERLTPLVYAELRRLARCNMAGEKGGHLLQPSALVNEAFVRLMGAGVEWESGTQFFAFSARVMRQILIDFARVRNAAKRGHRDAHVNVSYLEDLPGQSVNLVDQIDLDAALDDLARLDARQARVVELRYFGGLDNGEIAAVLGISEPTVVRDWREARAFLFDRLQPARNAAKIPGS